MSLDPKDKPDWATAGWDWPSAGDDRILVPRPTTPAVGGYKLLAVEDLQEIYKTLKVAHALHETPAAKKLEELSAELFILREKRNYWLDTLRAFAAGVLVAWIAWTMFGGPS